LVAEYAANANPASPQKEYGYRNGQLLVTAESSANIHWLVTDQLGTPRMIADLGGSLSSLSRHDYLPFGEELFAGTGGRTTAQGYSASDGVRQHFTKQERDGETSLDYFHARYYASLQGRFISPDLPFVDQSAGNPQSWNLYTYVGNTPLTATDPSGLWIEHECTGGGRCFEAEKGDSLSTLAKQFHLNYKDLVNQFGNVSVEVGQTLLVLNSGSIPTSRDEGPAVVQVFLVQPPREREEFQRSASAFIHKYLNPCPPHVQCGVFFPGGMGALEGDLTGLTMAERAMVEELVAEGRTVRIIPRATGKTADFEIDGQVTELKTLTQAGPNTLKNAIENASQQGDKVLVDARNVNISPSEALRQIQRAQGNIGGLQGRVTVLTRGGNVSY